MIKLYLFDIEGTTTDINFVHKVLFPYSSEAMEKFILEHQETPGVKSTINEVKKTVKDEENLDLSLEEVINQLLSWIKEDRKHPALKELQGLIWNHGYINNHFKGHVYTDVQPFFKKILTAGFKVGIYSSGSEKAQKLIFGYSSEGDLTPLISYYFDTKVGGKREMSSYEKIASEVNLRPEEIHFFSDIPEELKAARSAGMSVTQVARDNNPKSEFSCITSFHSYMERI